MFCLLRRFLFYVCAMAGAVVLFLLLLSGHWLGYWLAAVFFVAAGAEAWKRRMQWTGLIR
jgi:hypothetical protein